MSVRGSTSKKPLAFLTSLMVLFALVVPLIGTALANHGGTNEGLVLSMAAPANGTTGGCVLVSVQVNQTNSSGPVAEGETIDISLSQQDTDQNRDLSLAFCDPDTTGPATDLTGAPPNPLSGQQTPGNAGPPAQDCDDDAATGQGIPGRVEGACANVAGTETPAVVAEECFTDANGRCQFGITTNKAGTIAITSWFEECAACVQDNTRQANEPFVTQNGTFTAGGTAAAKNITCTPANDTNPDGTRHEFQCTVTDASGTPLPGLTVSFDVLSGPNSEEIGPTNCGGGAAVAGGGGGNPGTLTGNSGQTAAPAPDQPTGGQPAGGGNPNACGYDDQGGAGNPNSPPGVDSITAYVNQGAISGGGAPTAGPNTGEPQVTLSKTWTSAGRTVDCEPETSTVGVGGTGTIVCTVRDNLNNPVQGVDVTLTQLSGPAAAIVSAGCPPAGQPPACARTNASGQATFSVSQGQQGATGTATFRGQITAPANATANCQNQAGNPSGAPAGICFDDVNVTWSQSTNTPPPQPQCNDGVDNDGDGLIDFGSASSNDPGCSAIDDNTESPNPTGPDAIKVNTAVSAPQKVGNKAKGSVVAGKAKCQKNRKVKVFKANGQSLGSDTTNNAGTYSEGIGDYDGRAYAVAPKKRINRSGKPDLICKKDRSPTVDL